MKRKAIKYRNDSDGWSKWQIKIAVLGGGFSLLKSIVEFLISILHH